MKKSKTGLPILNREELQTFINRWKETSKTKGILLMGLPGVGKTTILKNLLYNDTECISTDELVIRYMHQGIEGVSMNGQLHVPQKLIDDLGTEALSTHFGNKVDLIGMLIQDLYAKRIPKHFTTNLNMEELTERYGPRVVDRLKEMCYIIVLEDTSFRKLSEDIFEDIEKDITATKEAKKKWEEAEKERKRKRDEEWEEFNFPKSLTS